MESDRNLRMSGIGEVHWTRRAKRQNPTNHFRLDKLNCHRILLLVTTHCCLFPAPANPHIEHHSNSIAFLNCSFEPPGSLFRVQSDDFSGIGAIHRICAGMRVTAPRSKKGRPADRSDLSDHSYERIPHTIVQLSPVRHPCFDHRGWTARCLRRSRSHCIRRAGEISRRPAKVFGDGIQQMCPQ